MRRSGYIPLEKSLPMDGDSSENDRLYGDFLAECGGTCK